MMVEAMVNRMNALLCGLATALLLTACGPSAQPAEGTSGGTGQPSAPKKLIWILNLEPEGFSELFGGSSSTHWRMVYEALHDFLVVLDNNGDPVPRLALGLPSRDNGSWQLNADGTMETTWHLRSNARWHNGEPFRVADYVFGWRVARDPGVPFNKRAVATLIDRIDTPDESTLVFHWTGPYAYADRIQPFDLDPFPSWNASLVDAFENQKAQFAGHPWFSREFVGLGPYRLSGWAPGSYLTLQANDEWYGGKPKIDSIEARFILDANARLAAMLSGDGQFLHTTDLDQRRTWVEQAVASGRGQLIQHTVGRMQLAVVKQDNPIFGGPDRARQRQAMLYALDRETLSEILTGERTNVADSWLFKGSPKYEALRDKIVPYSYNPAEALRLLAETGWTRGTDGVMRDAAGQPYAFEYWQADTAASILRDQWQQIGFQVTLYERPPQLGSDLEFRASFPGVQPTGNAVSLSFIDGRFHSRNIPSPANRFGGLNWGGYSDPEADRLIEKLASTIDLHEAQTVEGDLVNLLGRNAIYFPYYIDAGASIAARGVTGIKPVNAACQNGDCEMTWNIHEWDTL